MEVVRPRVHQDGFFGPASWGEAGSRLLLRHSHPPPCLTSPCPTFPCPTSPCPTSPCHGTAAGVPSGDQPRSATPGKVLKDGAKPKPSGVKIAENGASSLTRRVSRLLLALEGTDTPVLAVGGPSAPPALVRDALQRLQHPGKVGGSQRLAWRRRGGDVSPHTLVTLCPPSSLGLEDMPPQGCPCVPKGAAHSPRAANGPARLGVTVTCVGMGHGSDGVIRGVSLSLSPPCPPALRPAPERVFPPQHAARVGGMAGEGGRGGRRKGWGVSFRCHRSGGRTVGRCRCHRAPLGHPVPLQPSHSTSSSSSSSSTLGEALVSSSSCGTVLVPRSYLLSP